MTEFDAVMAGRPSTAVTLDDIRKLPMLDAFINEVLRMRSPARGTLLRKAVQDFQLGSERIRKGSACE